MHNLLELVIILKFKILWHMGAATRENLIIYLKKNYSLFKGHFLSSLH